MPVETLEKPLEMPPVSVPDCPLTLDMMEQAADAGIRLEYIRGVGGIWETMPLKRHQRHIDRIRASLHIAPQTTTSGCGCFHYADLSMRFPDGSAKRPNIAIFCTRLFVAAR